jgi:hypothetical protein
MRFLLVFLGLSTVAGKGMEEPRRAQHPALGGQTPLQRMCAGDVTDLAAVRSYLDAARAPWS